LEAPGVMGEGPVKARPRRRRNRRHERQHVERDERVLADASAIHRHLWASPEWLVGGIMGRVARPTSPDTERLGSASGVAGRRGFQV